MSNLRSFLLKWGPALLVSVVVVWLAVANFKSGTWLTGWDNVHPEFDFMLNITRSLSSTWKDFQGVGAVSGVAAAAELPRQLLLWILSPIIPANQLRYIWTFILLLVGGLGILQLFTFAFSTHLSSKQRALASASAALFYILNLGTLQQFAVPFETFTTQWAVLPWVIWSSLQWVTKPSGKHLLWLILSILFFTPASYVPTVFIVSLGAIGFILLGEILSSSHKGKVLTRSLIVGALLLVLNAYWLLPFFYYVFTNGQTTATSMINTFASVDARLANQEYGRLSDVVLLRGFLFEYVDAPAGGSPELLLQTWLTHISTPLIKFLGFGLFGVVALGVWHAHRTKTSSWLRFALLGLIGIFMLMSYNAPLGWLFNAASTSLPFFGEIFRYTFTKFVVIVALIYALFFGLGVVALASLFAKIKRVSWLKSFVPVGVSLALVAWMFPAFTGSLFTERNQLAIPDEYFRVMEYFKTQPQQARIATLPQYAFWGWDVYTWGYRGSGWWRHGIAQPLLERTHDVWSQANEQYYKEISNAIYTQNLTEFSAVMDKYHIGWLLLDENLNYGNDRAISTIKSLIAQESDFQSEPLRFGKISIYPRKDANAFAQSFLTSTRTLVTSQSAAGPRDLIYSNEFDYITQKSGPTLWPFTQIDGGVNVVRRGNTFVAAAPITLSNPPLSSLTITTRDYFDSESLLPVTIFTQKSGTQLTIRLEPQTPTITLGNETFPITTASATKEITLTIPESLTTFYLQIGALPPLLVKNLSTELTAVGEQYISYLGLQTITVFDTTASNKDSLFSQLTTTPLSNCAPNSTGTFSNTFFEDYSFTLTGQKATPCLIHPIPSTTTGTLLGIDFQYKSTTTERPEVIVKSHFDQELNIPFLATTAYSKDWKDASFFIPNITSGVSAPNTISWALNAVNSPTQQSLSFRNPTISTYPQIAGGSVVFNRDDFLNEAKFNLPQNATDLTLSVTVPTLSTYPSTSYTATSNRNFSDSQNCDPINNGPHSKEVSDAAITYKARNSSECDTWDMRQFSTQWGGILEVSSTHVSGKPLQLCLTPSSTNHCDVISLTDTSFEPSTKTFTVYPKPRLTDGYLLNVTNHSIGRVTTENQLSSLSLTPFPVTWLSSIELHQPNTSLPPLQEGQTLKKHDSLYFLKGKTLGPQTVIHLRQAFDPGWVAITISPSQWDSWLAPLAIQSISSRLPHYVLNSWANAWVIEAQPDQEVYIAILFWPHILQQLGFGLCALTVITSGVVILTKRIKR